MMKDFLAKTKNKMFYETGRLFSGIEKGVYQRTEDLMAGHFPKEELGSITNPYYHMRKQDADKIVKIGQMLYSYDKFLYNHCLRVATFSAIVGKELGATDLHQLYHGGILHDIGKMFIPPQILYKNGRLTDDEFAVMKNHAMLGYQLLAREEIEDPEISEIAKSHHITYSGKGYPSQGDTKNPAVPMFVRIVTVADCFDAMSSTRIYSMGKTLDEVMVELNRCRGDMFDPEVSDVFSKYARSFYETIRK